jgi:hypothetical protein
MRTPTSVATQKTQLRRKGRACSKGTPVAYSDEWPSRGPWFGEASPTGVLTGVIAELSFSYGACWLYYRSSTPPHREKMR